MKNSRFLEKCKSNQGIIDRKNKQIRIILPKNPLKIKLNKLFTYSSSLLKLNKKKTSNLLAIMLCLSYLWLLSLY